MKYIHSVDELRAGHNAYYRGARDSYTLRLERAYNAWRKRLAYHQRRAELMGRKGCGCPECGAEVGAAA